MIEIQQLTKEFDGFVAVDDLSFTVDDGEIYGFIGPNGAGKSTTMKVLATLLDPTSGDATINGVSVVDAPETVRLQIGYMPDYYGVYDGIEVWEYLDFFAASYGFTRPARRQAIAVAMEITDLTPLSKKLVSSLSKGMKQRLCLAKTLIHDPTVLILDEPAAGLDPRARIELRGMLKELSRMGKTIIVSSHILSELSSICSSVGIIERGKLLASGSVQSIQEQLRPVRRVTFEFEQPADPVLLVIQNENNVSNCVLDGTRLGFDFAGQRAEIRFLIRLVIEQDFHLVGVQEERHDLEQLFMEVTRGDLA